MIVNKNYNVSGVGTVACGKVVAGSISVGQLIQIPTGEN